MQNKSRSSCFVREMINSKRALYGVPREKLWISMHTSESSYGAKLRNPDQFTVGDIKKIAPLLRFSPKEILSIFGMENTKDVLSINDELKKALIEVLTEIKEPAGQQPKSGTN